MTGFATGVTVGRGALLEVDSGSTSSVSVLSGGVVSVGSAGVVSTLNVSSGGVVYAFNDAVLEGVTLHAGAKLFHDRQRCGVAGL